MSSFEKYFTKENANSGVKMEIKMPDGSKTNDWVIVLGTDSKRFAELQADFRDVFLSDSSVEDKEASKVKIVAALIASWSFSEDCNEKNKLLLLENAPYIVDQINLFAADRMNYIKKK